MEVLSRILPFSGVWSDTPWGNPNVLWKILLLDSRICMRMALLGMNLTFVERIWWSNKNDIPRVRVRFIDQTSTDAFHGMPIELA